jgi:hypothetical protein
MSNLFYEDDLALHKARVKAMEAIMSKLQQRDPPRAIMSVAEIATALEFQGRLRAEENDIGGILLQLAKELRDRVAALEGERIDLSKV